MKNILDVTIPQMQEAMDKKEISCRELVLEYLSRIARYDRQDGGIRSISEINPDALFIADCLDQLRSRGETLGPLHGIPITLKDNIDTGDKMATSAGSLALSCNFAERDAFLVTKLRNAGALILGKTNMSEFARFLSTDAPSGYSSRGGQVLNPYFPGGETPGGSSSGSGAAVAARFCAASVGSDTCGSIIKPAVQNGLAGIRPSKGLISCSGVIPISNTMDNAGPMTRSVTDLAVTLGVMAGRNDSDITTHAAPLNVSYIEFLNSGLNGKRVGVDMDGLDNKTEEEIKAFEALLKILDNNGAVLTYLPDDLGLDMDYQPALDIMECEFKQSLNLYLSRLHGSGPRSMPDIIAYNQSSPALMLKYGQDRMLRSNDETSGAQTDIRYLNSLAYRELEIKKMERLFGENKLDVILRVEFTRLIPFVGFPCMNIPIGQKSNGVPIGSFWITKRFAEAAMIEITSAVERILDLSLAPDLDAFYL